MWRLLLFLPLLAAAQPAAFRLRLGASDTAPRAWDGSLSVSSGQLKALRNWRPRPGDRVQGTAWSLATKRGENDPTRTPQRAAFAPSPVPYLLIPGLIVDVADPAATVRFATKQGTFQVSPQSLRTGARFLNGSVLADPVPSADLLSGAADQDEFVTLAAGPGDSMWAAWLAWRDDASQILVRRHDGRQWSAPETLLSQPGDVHTVRLAKGRDGAICAIWAQQVEQNWDLYARVFRGGAWSRTERLTTDPQPDVFPRTATDSDGNVWVVWQGFRNGQSDIFARRFDGSRWSAEERISTSDANDWEPDIAADGAGGLYVAWDTYAAGNYDIQLRAWSQGRWSGVIPVASTPKYEAHVSLTCDRRNRLWLAWNESGFNWGKDTAYHVKQEGTPLHAWANAVVAVYENGQFRQPVADPNSVWPEGHKSYHDFPVIHADSKGRIWLLFRHRTVPVLDTPTANPTDFAVWETYATTLEGDRWNEPMPFPFSAGRGDMRSALANSAGGDLWAAWSTDNRDFIGGLEPDCDVYAGRIPAPASSPVEPRLREMPAFTQKAAPIHLNEKADISRIRGYVIESGGRSYRIYRGDTHRHTELSFDGGSDGTLFQAYRYAMDAAALDYLAVTEHCGVQNNTETVRCGPGGRGIRYYEYLVQQSVDLYSLGRSFIPIYAYERSVSAPNGHRNVLFPSRGNAYLPIPEEEHQGKTGAEALFAYLRPRQGITIPHTIATTDWRNHADDVQPLVEIYQGFRSSFEYEGAPRAPHSVNPLTGPGGGRKSAGYAWNAWAKGYHIGVQASSDHLSTHSSYSCTIASDPTRRGLLDAMKRRHNYGATDNIVLDYRLQTGGREFLQGEEVKTQEPFRLWVRVLGTAPIRQVDIIRNNTFVFNRQNLTADETITFEDREAAAGDSYYYVRVEQVDGQLAWSSPIWISR